MQYWKYPRLENLKFQMPDEEIRLLGLEIFFECISSSEFWLSQKLCIKFAQKTVFLAL